jgi:alkylhydroperoxidase family enzyme
VTTTAPRIEPLAKDRWDDDVHAAFRLGFGDAVAERFLATGPDAPAMPNAVGTMMQHPALAGRFLAYNNVLLFAPTLEPRWRELMILRVAWRTRASYEWVQHVRLSQRYTVTADEIDAVTQGADAGTWSALEADLLAATDQLIDGYRVHDDTWARLAESLDPRQLVELVFVVGTYTCLAMVFNGLEIELDPELQSVAAPPLPAPSKPHLPST